MKMKMKMKMKAPSATASTTDSLRGAAAASRKLVSPSPSPSPSSSFLHHVYLIITQEGVKGFFKGWTASYLRIGPQTCITFLIYEQMRKIVGLKQL